MKLNTCLLFSLLSIPALAQQPQNAIQRVQQRTFTIATIPQPGEVLTLQQAIAQATEKNYVKGNAGYLPVLTGNASSNGSIQNLRQTFLDALRSPLAINGAFNRTSNAGVNLNYVVFNGYARSATYYQLRQLVQISTISTRANIDATVADVATGYFDVVRQLQRLIAFTQALDISRERLELARATFEVGTRSRVDFLSAQVDYNTDSAALLSQQQSLRNAKILLNTFLVRDVVTEFAVRDTILVRPNLQLPSLQQSLTANNPQLVAAVLNRTLADVSVRLANAQQLPLITAQAGYNHQWINNQGGFGVRTGRAWGPTYNVQATIPIFNGYNLKRQIQNARVNTLIAQNQENDQRLQLQSALTQTYQLYQNSLALLNLEIQNNKLANQNVDIAYDRYRIGNSTFVEFRDVQRNAINAQIRLIEAEYNAKAAEIELLRLSSTITQELVQ